MLFSYTLIFFLFTTFVSAAPTTTPVLSKRASSVLEENKGLLTFDGGLWIPTKPVNREVTRMIWNNQNGKLVFRLEDDRLQSPPWHPASAFRAKTFDKLIVNGLCGTNWKLPPTGSIIKVIFKGEDDIDLEVVDKGRWTAGTITEEDPGVRPTWAPKRAPTRLEENTEFFTAETGLWIPTKPVNREVTRMIWKKQAGRLVFRLEDDRLLSPPWHMDSQFQTSTFSKLIIKSLCGTTWKRPATGSIIKVVLKDGGDMDLEVVNKGRWSGQIIPEKRPGTPS